MSRDGLVFVDAASFLFSKMNGILIDLTVAIVTSYVNAKKILVFS